MDQRWRPSVTVAAVIERDGRFLMIEEETSEGLRINNPAGHLEPGETPAEGCAREALGVRGRCDRGERRGDGRARCRSDEEEIRDRERARPLLQEADARVDHRGAEEEREARGRGERADRREGGEQGNQRGNESEHGIGRCR